jgi:hypothetical protein
VLQHLDAAPLPPPQPPCVAPPPHASCVAAQLPLPPVCPPPHQSPPTPPSLRWTSPSRVRRRRRHE